MGKSLNRIAATALSLSLAFTAAAFTPAQARFINHGFVGPDGETCRDVDGLPVAYDAASADYIAAGHVGISMAGNDRGTLRIIYDRALLASQPRIVRVFMLNHECELHRQGSVKGMQSGAYMETTPVELAADCGAAAAMTRAGMLRQRDLEKISAFFRRVTSSRIVIPPTEERIVEIRRCYEAAGPKSYPVQAANS